MPISLSLSPFSPHRICSSSQHLQIGPYGSGTWHLYSWVVSRRAFRPYEIIILVQLSVSVDARLTVWTADSLGVIKRWLLEGRALRFIVDESGHETSVARMVVGDDGLWSGGSSDAWPRLNGIVSMDKTATYHAFDSVKPATIPHSGYVKSVLPIPSASSGKSLVLTGSEDEEIRVWDVTHSPGAPAKLLSTVSGHCGEVSVMRWWQRQTVADGRPAWVIVSGSLDGTLRRWTLQGENTDTVPR